ncbi:MAG: hypothetical protein ACOZAM_13630 [Pseudomonadota bacterium]
MLRPLFLSLTLIFAASGAGAAEIAGRYVLEKVEQGFLRLDSQTGVMSLCAAPSGVWECRPVRDEGLDANEQLARLRDENEGLRKRLAELEKGGTTTKLPSDQEVDRMMDIFGKMFDRFLDFAREMDGKEKSGTSL